MRTLSNIWQGRLKVAVSALVVVCAAQFAALPAHANNKYSGIVVDAKTGKTLYEYKADQLRYPASLTKMMTMYMIFDALDRKKVTKKTKVRMTKNAAAEQPSKLGIRAGRYISMENAIYALATKSANDVATAVGEHLGGSEQNFAKMMTHQARKLGMSKTTFKNAHGLTAKGQLTTARDMARLGVSLREHFPHYYKYFSTRKFKYGKRVYGNHNRLLGRVRGVDGIKTGYTRASGFNLVSSVYDRKRSIVATVMGGRSGKSRNAQMSKLIRQYLPKATTAKKKYALAPARNGNTVYVASNVQVNLPKRGPLPVFRPTEVAKVETKPTIDVTKPVQVASASGIMPKSTDHVEDFNQAKLQARLLQTGGNKVVPVANPKKGADDNGSQLGYVDPMTTASFNKAAKTQKHTNWIIQIGASDSKEAAVNLLVEAKEKAPQILGNKSIYTEEVKTNGITLHRARFVGFASKRDARNVCKSLKKKKLDCIALSS